jgi:hypothetical protein
VFLFLFLFGYAIGCGVICGMLAFTELGALGSAMVADAPPLEGQFGPPASADWMPSPPTIRNEPIAMSAMVARRIDLLFIV